MAKSQQLSLFGVLAAAFTIAHCGGPLTAALKTPAEPALPTFDKFNTSSDCNAASTSDTALDLKSTVTYKDSISRFLKDNCTSCHKAGGDLPNLSTYKNARTAAKFALKSLDDDTMPPKESVAAKDKANFAAWVADGMPESSAKSLNGTACTAPKKPAKKSTSKPKINAGTDTSTDASKDASTNGAGTAQGAGPSTTSATITYKSTIKPYLDAKCGACHGRAPVLTSYTSAKAAAAASVASMRGGNMPPGGKAAATDISNLQGWIDAGYPE
ncbi:MAG: hypothetical protein NTY08_18195 [Proteobacteria bacterium]|nr:hypothetical protein [Pseudomonadota bacterium]